MKEEDGRAGTCEEKGRCYRSQKKNEALHTVKLKIAGREERKCGRGRMFMQSRVNITVKEHCSYNSKLIIAQVIKVTLHRSGLYATSTSIDNY